MLAGAGERGALQGGDGKLFPCYIKSFSFFRGVQFPPPHRQPCLQVNQPDPTRGKCFSSVGKSFQDFLPGTCHSEPIRTRNQDLNNKEVMEYANIEQYQQEAASDHSFLYLSYTSSLRSMGWLTFLLKLQLNVYGIKSCASNLSTMPSFESLLVTKMRPVCYQFLFPRIRSVTTGSVNRPRLSVMGAQLVWPEAIEKTFGNTISVEKNVYVNLERLLKKVLAGEEAIRESKDTTELPSVIRSFKIQITESEGDGGGEDQEWIQGEPESRTKPRQFLLPIVRRLTRETKYRKNTPSLNSPEGGQGEGGWK
ncbi:hypothetical protein J6590_004342 [Homalodisca vitripennis]|nr:hypothetical protein J6590_004342 [Homalodisca vitripennis]